MEKFTKEEKELLLSYLEAEADQGEDGDDFSYLEELEEKIKAFSE